MCLCTLGTSLHRHIYIYIYHMFSGHIALNDPIHDGGVKLTYSEAASRISKLAGGLQALRLTKGDKIGLFAENSYRSQLPNFFFLLLPKFFFCRKYLPVCALICIHIHIHAYIHAHAYINAEWQEGRSLSRARARSLSRSLSQTHTHTHGQIKHRNALLKEIEPVPKTLSTD